MSRILWFQRPNDEPFQFLCDDGIHIPRLAEKLNFEANTLMLNDVGVDFNAAGYLTSMAFLHGYGNTRAKPIKVTGRPSGAAATTAGVPAMEEDPTVWDVWATVAVIKTSLRHVWHTVHGCDRQLGYTELGKED